MDDLEIDADARTKMKKNGLSRSGGALEQTLPSAVLVHSPCDLDPVLASQPSQRTPSSASCGQSPSNQSIHGDEKMTISLAAVAQAPGRSYRDSSQ